MQLASSTDSATSKDNTVRLWRREKSAAAFQPSNPALCEDYNPSGLSSMSIDGRVFLYQSRSFTSRELRLWFPQGEESLPTRFYEIMCRSRFHVPHPPLPRSRAILLAPWDCCVTHSHASQTTFWSKDMGVHRRLVWRCVVGWTLFFLSGSPSQVESGPSPLPRPPFTAPQSVLGPVADRRSSVGVGSIVISVFRSPIADRRLPIAAR